MEHRHRLLIGVGLAVSLVAALTLIAVGGGALVRANGSVYFVDADAGGGGGDGSSWATAFNDLQTALNVPGDGYEIWVAEGTYKPSIQHGGTGERYKSFQMKNGVAIYGGFAGTELERELRDWDAHPTVLSGDLDGDDGSGFVNRDDNSYHVFYHEAGTALNATAVLDGFTIRGGNADAAPSHYQGGGMYNWGSSPTLANCTFEDNQADLGGGMHNTIGSAPTLTGCNFAGNSAEYGGGMSNYDSSPELTGCAFTANWADYGGGLYDNYYSSPTLTGCTFTNNSAGYDGGGMFNENDSMPILIGCTFEDNSATFSGGGIANDGAAPTLTDCTFSGNTAGTEGGAIHNNFSSPTLTGCTFNGNSADAGGGIYNNGSSPDLIDCTLVDNSANSGGGMHNNGSAGPTLINCTFRGNTAVGLGGGMRNTVSSSPTLTNCTFEGNSANRGGAIQSWDSTPVLTNCILWGNVPQEMSNYDDDSTPTVSFSDIEGGCDADPHNICGEGNIDADPLFVDADNGDYHLRLGSPCIDAGTGTAPNLPDHDFEGDPRQLDGDGDGTAFPDMGVDELLAYPVYLPLVLRAN